MQKYMYIKKDKKDKNNNTYYGRYKVDLETNEKIFIGEFVRPFGSTIIYRATEERIKLLNK